LNAGHPTEKKISHQPSRSFLCDNEGQPSRPFQVHFFALQTTLMKDHHNNKLWNKSTGFYKCGEVFAWLEHNSSCAIQFRKEW
jgi:hypothetical protein